MAAAPVELPEHLKKQVIREFIPGTDYLSIGASELDHPRQYRYGGVVHQFFGNHGGMIFKPISLPSPYGITHGMFNLDVKTGATNTGGTEGENNTAGTGSTGGRRHTSRRSKRKSHKSRRRH